MSNGATGTRPSGAGFGSGHLAPAAGPPFVAVICSTDGFRVQAIARAISSTLRADQLLFATQAR